MSSEKPRASQDDEFRSFFHRRYNPTLRRLTSRERNLSQHDADAIVSQAFFELHQAWRQVRDPDGFLWDVVKKRNTDFWRKKETRLETLYAEVTGETASVDGGHEHCIDVLQLDQLIGQLSIEDQRVIRMSLLGVSNEEQAEALNTTAAAARTRLSRAKQRLKAMAQKEAGVR